MTVFVEKFADIKILRYTVPGFENMDIKSRLYIYYLSQAALCGRDILWDQNNIYNLRIRAVLETIFKTFSGKRNTGDFMKFEIYLKRVWFSNGIHHHYSTEKIPANFEEAYFDEIIKYSDWSDFKIKYNCIHSEIISEIKNVIFRDNTEFKRVNLDQEVDIIIESANNYYQNVNQAEVENFYVEIKNPTLAQPISYGLNSSLIKENGKIIEKTWFADGKYGAAIKQIIYWLKKASLFTENSTQKSVIEKLILYYNTGDLHYFDLMNVEWVGELSGEIDFINGFIEVYGDSLGIKGSWEALVNIRDSEASKRATIMSQNAQWFEKNAPVNEEFKKTEIKGISAKVINVAILGGDCYPATPIGINLPNSEWIREKYGSKSVTIENITQSYFIDSLGNGMLEEFAFSIDEIERAKKYGLIAGNLHTDLHECLGHGSGKLNYGISTDSLKNYYSTIEETRADLFALYYIIDDKMLELKLIPSIETAYAEYDAYLRNGLLTQLTRIEAGKNIEESHMRNRQLISKWVYEKGRSENIVEFIKTDEKTFVKINDYLKLRTLFGQLLSEVQRIKSEGDFEAAKDLIETYGVKVDYELHIEILNRFKTLNLSAYSGFVNPVYKLITDTEGNPFNVEIDYSEDYNSQMLRYSNDYSFLPLVN